MRKNRKIKLLIVTDYFYPHWTGLSKSVYNLISSLKKRFNITVLTVRYNNCLKKKETILFAQVIREDYIFILSRSCYSINLVLKSLFLLVKHDIVLFNSPCSNILPISIVAKLFRRRLLIFHQGDLILPKGITNRIIEKIFDVSSLVSFMLADKVSTYTEDYAKNSRVFKPFLHKFHPLLLPILLQNSKQTDLGIRFKEIRKLRKQGIVIFGFAGRFVEEKGFDILFDAIPKVIQKNIRAHFVFAGEVNVAYENFFQQNLDRFKKVKEYVTLLGLLSSSEMDQFYKSIDFIIIPSRSDCFPLVQAEAMLSSVPSVVSNIPGARYLVKKTGFGLIFGKEDTEDLAEKIIEATKYRKDYLKHHKNVLELLDKKRNVEKIREFIES